MTLGRRSLLAAAACLAAGRAKAQLPILPPGDQLHSGQFAWQLETAPSGPVMILVSLTEQLARVYRNGVEIGNSTVSSGRTGHDTPTGVFTILQKARVHHSSTYDEASMPFTERLTWDGVALQAGGVPGYPSSHGCVHLPLAFAKLLFDVTTVGTSAVIADAHSAPQDLVHPGLILPKTELPADGGDFVWEPQRAPEGPLSFLVSIADRRLYGYRNGEEIGSAAVSFAKPDEPILPAVYIMLDRAQAGPPVWTEVGLFDARGSARRSDALDRLVPPAAFTTAVAPTLRPGTSLYCALGAASPATRTGPGFTVLATHAA
jgi:hypothetical protein